MRRGRTPPCTSARRPAARSRSTAPARRARCSMAATSSLPDDVKELAYATLGHRIIISPAARVKNVTAKEIVEQTLERIPVPGARARDGAPRSPQAMHPQLRPSARSIGRPHMRHCSASIARSSSTNRTLTGVVILVRRLRHLRHLDRLLARLAPDVRRLPRHPHRLRLVAPQPARHRGHRRPLRRPAAGGRRLRGAHHRPQQLLVREDLARGR